MDAPKSDGGACGETRKSRIHTECNIDYAIRLCRQSDTTMIGALSDDIPSCIVFVGHCIFKLLKASFSELDSSDFESSVFGDAFELCITSWCCCRTAAPSHNPQAVPLCACCSSTFFPLVLKVTDHLSFLLPLLSFSPS